MGRITRGTTQITSKSPSLIPSVRGLPPDSSPDTQEAESAYSYLLTPAADSLKRVKAYFLPSL